MRATSGRTSVSQPSHVWRGDDGEMYTMARYCGVDRNFVLRRRYKMVYASSYRLFQEASKHLQLIVSTQNSSHRSSPWLHLSLKVPQ